MARQDDEVGHRFRYRRARRERTAFVLCYIWRQTDCSGGLLPLGFMSPLRAAATGARNTRISPWEPRARTIAIRGGRTHARVAPPTARGGTPPGASAEPRHGTGLLLAPPLLLRLPRPRGVPRCPTDACHFPGDPAIGRWPQRPRGLTQTGDGRVVAQRGSRGRRLVTWSGGARVVIEWCATCT